MGLGFLLRSEDADRPRRDSRGDAYTEDPVDDRALLEEQDRRDRPDPIPSRQPRILVDIDLHQRHPTFRGRGQLLEGGRDRLTWTAPLCPEVDHHETLVREQRLVEVLLGQVESLGYSVLKVRGIMDSSWS